MPDLPWYVSLGLFLFCWYTVFGLWGVSEEVQRVKQVLEQILRELQK